MPAKKSRAIAFTQKRIADLPIPTTGRSYARDTQVPGLIVDITPGGSKVYYVYRKLAGRPLRVKIGPIEEFTVDDARTAAEVINGKIAKGIDPQEEKRQKRQGETLKDLFTHWLDTYAKLHKRTWADDERQFNKYLGEFHNRRLDAIKSTDVTRWHGRMGQEHGPVQANRTLALLSTVFNAAGKVGFTGRNPCDGVKRFREESRERFLKPDEMRAFFTALSAATREKPIWRDFFLLCLFTGARRGNVASMRWDELDLSGGTWVVPGGKSKNKKPLAISLSPFALKILLERQEQRNGNPWVFPAPSATGHIVDPRKIWGKILSEMRQCEECGAIVGSAPKKCPACHRKLPKPEPVDLHIHDLRRSLGSWQAAANVSLPIIGRSLGHANLKSTQVYARLQLDPVRESVTQASAAMIETARKGATNNGLPHGTDNDPLTLILNALIPQTESNECKGEPQNNEQPDAFDDRSTPD